MKIGFFGAGHMGSAMIQGLIASGKIPAQDILVKGGRSQTAKKRQKELGFTLVDQLEDLTEASLLIVAVNPAGVLPIIQSLPAAVTDKKIPLVSVAAGVDIAEMTEVLGSDYPLAHCIPNTPVSVNEGVLGISYSEQLSAADKEIIDQSLQLLGSLIEIDESLLGIVGSVAGCGPAFVDLFIEALSDASVFYGLNRELSYQIAEQMIKGAAELALQSKKHPGELKDGVATPGGTTIKGVVALEKHGFRNAVIEGVKGTIE
ncbi:pyrroline-5-carboxylate reductase [Enterococcus sp. AZ072]|uniref:pyrroline-5-carboxylate reductase n=1 Tax=unclassified Enterococcus TaxID=2608891 RepID=UPI003D28238E